MTSAIATPKGKKLEPIQFTGLTPAEQKLITQAQSKIAEVVKAEATVKTLSEEAGHYLYDARAIGRKDRNRYSITLDGKTQNVGRFDAVINSVGIARASAYRWIRAWEAHLMATNPVPASVIQMATNNGVLALDSTDEAKKAIAMDALADAFLAAGQPTNPTPTQAMAIVADACERAAAAEEKQTDIRQTALVGVATVFRDYYQSYMKGGGITSPTTDEELGWLLGAQFIAYKLFGAELSDAVLLALGRGTVDTESEAAVPSAAGGSILSPIQADVDASHKKQ